MQVISRVEQPSSASSNITPKSAKDLMQTIAKVLENAKISAHQMKILYNNINQRLGFKVEDDHQHGFDHHSWVTLNAFETCLSMLTSYDFDHQDGKFINNNKRKIDRSNHVQFSDHDHHDRCSKSEVISDANTSKDRSYKRRKTGQSWTVEATTLIDDRYAWRKYGQKEINNTKYPRSYYRCTNKHEQNCQATKQVQQISKNPNKYKIIYHGQHTCKNLCKTSSIIIDNSTFENSSCFLSFDTKNYHTPKHALNSSLFPPSSAFSFNSAHHDHHSCGAQKQYPSTPSSSSSSDICPPSSSSDLTSTGLSSTPVYSDQSDVISPPDEIYSSTSIPYEMDQDVFISLFNLDQDYHPRLDGLF